jgi:hypothetical protein
MQEQRRPASRGPVPLVGSGRHAARSGVAVLLRRRPHALGGVWFRLAEPAESGLFPQSVEEW